MSPTLERKYAISKQVGQPIVDHDSRSQLDYLNRTVDTHYQLLRCPSHSSWLQLVQYVARGNKTTYACKYHGPIAFVCPSPGTPDRRWCLRRRGFLQHGLSVELQLSCFRPPLSQQRPKAASTKRAHIAELNFLLPSPPLLVRRHRTRTPPIRRTPVSSAAGRQRDRTRTTAIGASPAPARADVPRRTVLNEIYFFRRGALMPEGIGDTPRALSRSGCWLRWCALG
ncbi:hypothetical protein BKA93DRAFT_103773 [Sparassis latifolia]